MVSLLKKRVRSNQGQTSLEYLLLLGATFITAYFVATGPMATFTVGMINKIKEATQNIVRNAELSPGGREPGQAGHPSSRNRLRPLHL